MRFLAAISALVVVIYGSQVCVDQACSPKNTVADFVFLIDSSEALSKADFEAVRTVLLNMSSALTINSATGAQMAIYTYATRIRSAGLIKNLNTQAALQTAINALQYDGTEDRNLQLAIAQEEIDVTPDNGFRTGVKKVLVVFEGDEFTGQSPFNRQLDTVRAKFDMILVIGVGEQAIRNNYENTKKLAGAKTDVFWAFNTDHIAYTQLWIQNNACPGSHVPATTPVPTTIPTQSPSVPCKADSVNYDVYLLLDVSAAITPSDFEAMKQQALSFVSVYPLGDKNVNFGLVSVGVDASYYYTGFHNNQDRTLLRSTISLLNQDAGVGQRLVLALRATNTTFLAPNYSTPNKLIVYFSGNTDFDEDPSSMISTLSSTYGVKVVAVKWNAKADASKLAAFAGGAKCVYDATTQPGNTATWLETQLCQKQFCR